MVPLVNFFSQLNSYCFYSSCKSKENNGIYATLRGFAGDIEFYVVNTLILY